MVHHAFSPFSWTSLPRHRQVCCRTLFPSRVLDLEFSVSRLTPRRLTSLPRLGVFLSQLGLMDDAGNVREDLKLPSGPDDAEALARAIQAAFDEGKELVLTVLKAMGEEQVNAMKEAPKAD